VGIPSPSWLYRFVLANPDVAIEAVEGELPEEHRVAVEQGAGKETYYCRFGLVVPATGHAQWMHDREPCHPAGFSRHDYIRHFYQFHLGLGRVRSGSSRTDQLSRYRSPCLSCITLTLSRGCTLPLYGLEPTQQETLSNRCRRRRRARTISQKKTPRRLDPMDRALFCFPSSLVLT
jgi:hypothetical protein